MSRASNTTPEMRRGLDAHSTAQTRRKAVVGAGLVLALASACASLPDTARNQSEQPGQAVRFEGADGPVSGARTDAILDRLEGAGGDSDLLQKHLTYEQAVNASSPLVLGNKLTLLQNGPDTYKVMFADIRAARHNINLETFIFEDDNIGQQFSALLLQRQAAGIQVHLIHDSVGAISTPAAFYDHLRDGGIKVLEFNPINPMAGHQKGWLLNNRDHRKQLIVDGRIAYTGGINISNTYSSAPSGGHSRHEHDEATDATPDASTGWRDTHIRIEGPVVAEFQKLFLDTWTRQNGAPISPGDYLPDLQAQGSEIVRAIGSRSGDPQSLIYLTLISAITHAELSVHLTIAYFAPDPQLLKALIDASHRGVDVSLVLPSYSDSWATFNLGRSYYTTLLRGGVKIHERRGAITHAKTACIDGVWSTIGSTNLDWRSFLHNDEINAEILGRDFAQQMETMFTDDLHASTNITLDRWRRRSLILRMKEQTARLAAYWL